MATAASITSQLSAITIKHSDYLNALTTNSSQSSNAATTTASNSQLELQLRELKRQLQTMNKQYLDASETKTDATILQRAGLSTFEDWALAGFFFSLALFCLITTGYLASLSTFPWRVTILGLVMTVIVMGGASVLIKVLG